MSFTLLFFFQFVFVYVYKHIARGRAQHIACASTNPPHYTCTAELLLWSSIWYDGIYYYYAYSHIASLLDVYGAGGGVHKNSWYFAIIRTARDEPRIYILMDNVSIHSILWTGIHNHICILYWSAEYSHNMLCRE